MKLLIINSVCGVGSTGRICADIAKEYEAKGWDARIAYGRYAEVPDDCRKYAIRIGNRLDVWAHVSKTRLFDMCGFGSKRATKRFLEWAEAYKPDLLWLHNLHNYYINVELLFQWIKQHPEMKVKWTLHDCWAFTGHCVYYSIVGCEKWKTGCYRCPNKDEYPASLLLDCSTHNFQTKKRLFSDVANMSIITPSQWLLEQVKQSFLKDYPIEVRYNTVDQTVFKPTSGDFRERYGLQEKIVLLGVAAQWTKRKGLADVQQLAQLLDDRFCIVLVGKPERDANNPKCRGNENRDLAVSEHNNNNGGSDQTVLTTEYGTCIRAGYKNLYREILQQAGRMHLIENTKEIQQGRSGGHADMIHIPGTDSRHQLAELYSAADLFINPTYEDTLPTVNLEARACGTYIITYDTGGCRETI